MPSAALTSAGSSFLSGVTANGFSRKVAETVKLSNGSDTFVRRKADPFQHAATMKHRDTHKHQC